LNFVFVFVLKKVLYGWIIHPITMRSFDTRKIALLSVLTAVSIGIQLSPRPPNVEFTSFITFLVGVLYGGVIGGVLGGFVMFVNGFLSPWGFAGLMMPFQMVGMAIMGLAGGIYKRYMAEARSAQLCVEAAVLGAFLTLIYDIITNTGVAVAQMLSGVPLLIALMSALFAGAFFSLIHTISNFILFGSAFIPLMKALRGVLGRETLWLEREPLRW